MSDEVTQETTEIPVEQKKIQSLDPGRFQSGEYIRNFYVITAHEDQEPKDLHNPEFWAHVANKLKPYDRIEARANDGTWIADAVVLDVGRNWAKVKVLQAFNLSTSDVSQTQAAGMTPFQVKFRGPHCKWSVIRKSDGEVLQEKLGTQGDAELWLKNYLKAM